MADKPTNINIFSTDNKPVTINIVPSFRQVVLHGMAFTFGVILAISLFMEAGKLLEWLINLF